MANDNPSERELALSRCDDQIAWYEAHAKGAARYFAVFQSLAIALGAATPILILWTSVPKPVQALPAALASVAAGLVGTFRWLDARTRFSATAEALKSERVLYETRTPPYGRGASDDESLATFVTHIEQIAMAEVGEWRTQIMQPPPKS